MAENTETPWFAQDADAVLAAVAADRDAGLTPDEARRRLAEHGPNAIAAEPAPSAWQVALRQLADPMNVMLVAVAVISLVINQVSVGILVGALVILNVFLGARQELKAKASVDALAKMQIPQAKVVRGGTLAQVDATTLVPGDIVALEAGDIVPADGRILMPSFVQAMLSYGSRQLAEHKAVVKNLTDVETLGATSAINSDKTGTLTMNEMTVESLYAAGEWFTVAGSGYEKTGEIRRAAGTANPDFTQLALALTLCNDSTVSDDGAVIGDPTEAALVVLAAKMGADAELTRAEYPRLAEVPFDSAYKFMATYHQLRGPEGDRLVAVVKGGPDVVLERCGAVFTADGPAPIEAHRQAVLDANRSLSEQGLRVLAIAFRRFDEGAPVPADPMAEVRDLTLVGLVGIIDPLRPSSKEAVRIARQAGIEVRMITGDHAITAAAIGAKLGLGDGAASGAEIQAMSDEELKAKLPHLHVFGRVTPEDKLRLARLMQEEGAVVAMTGDAVNDAAALKQADIGVAMGSGSEVTKQAGKMILVDDNFGTLVTAVRLGRVIYEKIVSYVRYQMSQLSSLVLLFLAASIFNINDGVPLTPVMVLFLNFFISIFPVIVILLDPAPDGIMDLPPRDPKKTIANGGAVVLWFIYGGLIFITSLLPLLIWPDQASSTEANAPVTMVFVIAAFGSIFGGLVMRRDPQSGLAAPILVAVKWLSIPLALTVAAVEIGFLQRLVGTTSLDGTQWLVCIGLSLLVPLLVEVEKAIRRRRQVAPTPSR